jgi:DNA polymerase
MGTDIDEELAYKAVNAYRSNYAKIPRLWKMLEEAAIAAVAERGRETVYRQVAFFADKNWLLVRLPSGRKLFYHRPRLVTYAGPYGERVSLEYMAVNSMTKKWGPERTFGGKLTENIVQGLCRDLIADAMLRLEEQGYPVIASVHDEVISEVPLGEGTVDEMVRIMCELPEWAKGFPLAAEGKESVRYGK